MVDVVSYGAAALAVVSVVALVLFAEPTVQSRFFAVAVATLAVSVLLAAPATVRWAAGWEWVSVLCRSGTAVGAIVASYCLIGVVVWSTRPPESARRLVELNAGIAAVVSVVVVACLVAADVPASGLRTLVAADPWVTAHVLTRFAYTVPTAGIFLVLAVRAVRLPEVADPARVAFRLAAAATGIALLHAMWTIGLHLRVWDRPPAQSVAALIIGVTLTLASLAAAAPVWVPRSRWGVYRWRVRRARRELQRLWRDLQPLRDATGVPGPVAAVSTAGAPRPVADLYRLAVAIGDAQWYSRPYVHPYVAGWVERAARAAGLDDDAAATMVTAASLAAAQDSVCARADRRYATGAPEVDRRQRARRSTDRPPHPRAPVDVLAEARRLARVRYAMRHSVLVDEARRRAVSDLPNLGATSNSAVT